MTGAVRNKHIFPSHPLPNAGTLPCVMDKDLFTTVEGTSLNVGLHHQKRTASR